MSRRPVIVGLGVLVVVGVLVDGAASSSGRRASAGPAGRVLVLSRSVTAGSSIDPAIVRPVAVDPVLVPAGAIVSVDQVAFRRAAVALPAGLPLVPSLLRRPGRTIALRAGERAVGVRVDDVAGLPSILDVGSRVDVLVGRGGSGAPFRIAAAVVLDRPRRSIDGEAWAVVLRLAAPLAARVGEAGAAGRDIRLLARADR